MGYKCNKTPGSLFQSWVVVSLFPPIGQLQYELLPKPTVKSNHYSLQEKKKSSSLWGIFFWCKSCWLWHASHAHTSCGGFQMVPLCRLRLSTKCGPWIRWIRITWELIMTTNSWSFTVLLNQKLWDLGPAMCFNKPPGDSNEHLILRTTDRGWSFLQNYSHFYACVFGPSSPSIWHASFFSAWQALKSLKKYPLLFVSLPDTVFST